MSLPELDILKRQTLDKTLGFRYLELDKNKVVLEMDVTPDVHQPFGYLHGGASMALAESAASIGGFLNCQQGHAAFGMEINANHLRPMKEGLLRATATPLHRGQSTQVWEVRLTDGRERLICISRCTLAVVKLDRS